MRCDWFILPLLLPIPTICFSQDHKRNVSDRIVSGVGRKWKHADSSSPDPISPRLWLRLRLRFWFSLGRKRSYDSAYDSDSVASENQPLECLRCACTEAATTCIPPHSFRTLARNQLATGQQSPPTTHNRADNTPTDGTTTVNNINSWSGGGMNASQKACSVTKNTKLKPVRLKIKVALSSLCQPQTNPGTWLKYTRWKVAFQGFLKWLFTSSHVFT